MLIEDLLQLIEKHKYILYTKKYQLNIVGVRSKNGAVNKFNDTIYVFYKDANDNWTLRSWAVTVDPGITYMKKLLNPKGAGALVAGQYVNVYMIDKHQGKYDALCQRNGPVKVYRDKNKDDKYDFVDASIDSGMFGVNIHKAGIDSINVDGWSAACSVFKRIKDFNEFMSLAYLHEKNNGNKFTYTLIDLNKE
jgi:hypothetical protein